MYAKVSADLLVSSTAASSEHACGQVAYGLACSEKDLKKEEKVTIKMIAAFTNNTKDCKRTLHESRLLRHFKHEKLVAFRYLCIADGDRNSTEVVDIVTGMNKMEVNHLVVTGSR